MPEPLKDWFRVDGALRDLQSARSQAAVIDALLHATDGLFHVDRALGDAGKLTELVCAEWRDRGLGEVFEWEGSVEDAPPGLHVSLHRPRRPLPFEAITVDFVIAEDEIEGLGIVLANWEKRTFAALLHDSLIGRPLMKLDPAEVFFAATKHLKRPAADVANAVQVVLLVARDAVSVARERLGDVPELVQAQTQLEDAEVEMADYSHHASYETAAMHFWAEKTLSARSGGG